jgi:hypothetical protein
MIVTVPVAFNVKVVEGMADDDELTETQAKDAAMMVVWDHLSLTKFLDDVADFVEVHVGGFGLCRVRMVDDQ